MIARSIQVPCFQAAITPIGTATRTAKMIVVVASANVGSIRCSTIVPTEVLERIEVPRSPCSNRISQSKNWR